eukprot:763109-Hanusia_phi.AAC.6
MATTTTERSSYPARRSIASLATSLAQEPCRRADSWRGTGRDHSLPSPLGCSTDLHAQQVAEPLRSGDGEKSLRSSQSGTDAPDT